jgi:uncharacterized protein
LGKMLTLFLSIVPWLPNSTGRISDNGETVSPVGGAGVKLFMMGCGLFVRKTMVAWPLIGLLLLYLGGCAVLFFRQRQLIFFPQAQPSHPIPSDFWLSPETVKIPVGNGQLLTGWWFPQDQSPKAVIFLHGNGGLMDANFRAIALWHQAGYGALVFNYRGYGSSGGDFPREAQVYEDAIAAHDFLTQVKGISPENLMLHGHSLGGAIAVELASQRPVAGLLLESTFTAMSAMATTKPLYRLFPVPILLNQRFDSAAKIAQLQQPIVITHGDQDDLVPPAMGETLWAIAHAPKQFVLIPGADHINSAAIAPDKIQAGIFWLEQNARRSLDVASSLN